MAKIETTFAFYQTKAAYNEQVNNGGGFADTTVVFIKDKREIATHGMVVCSMDEFFKALLKYAKYDANGNLSADGFIHRGGGASDLLTADGGLVPKSNFAPARKYAELDADDNLTVMGDIDANGNLHTYGTVSVESGSSDDILMADGSFQSLQQLKNTISSVPKFSVKVVSALPATGDESTIYLLKSGGDEGNLYTEYLYVNGAWEMLGAQSLNLSEYAKVDDLNDVNNKVPASANATDNGGDIEILFGNTSGKYLFSAIINTATPTSSGLMSAADKAKLDSALTEHQKLYIFTVKVNGVELEVYKPNAMAGEIDLTPEILGALSNDDGKAIAKAIAEAVARAQEAYSYTDNLRNEFDAHTHPYLPLTGGEVNGSVTVAGEVSVDKLTAMGDIDANGNLHTYGTVSVESGSSDDILMADGSFQSLHAIKDTISAIPKFRTFVVDRLPYDEEVKSESAIYLVKSGNDTQNLYTEYIWINGAWEELGTQKVNLDGYLTESNLSIDVYEDTENELYIGLSSENSWFGEAMLPIASTSSAGLMSTDDKKKLNGIEEGANKYVLPNASASAIGGVKINTTANSSPVVTPGSHGYGANRTYYVQASSAANGLLVVTVPWENTTYGVATPSAAGLMSAADKTKLDSALTEHQKLYIFTVKVNGVELEVYKPNAMAGEIDLTPEILGALSHDDGKAIAKAIAEAVARAQEAYSYTDNLRNQFDAHTHPYLPLTGGEVNGNVTVAGEVSVDKLTVMGDIDANGNLHTYGTVSVESGSSDDILMADGSFQSLQAIKDTISAIPKFRTIVVNSLPDDAEFKSESAIYLVKSGNDAQNLYTEYIWINGAWEKLGEQKVNLDNYLTTSNLTVKVYDDTENEIYIELSSGNSSFGEAMLPIASPTKAGLMSTNDKTKLDKLKTDFDDHTHDDRYYTEDEINKKLSSKSDTNHTHDFSSITNKPTTAAGYGITDAITSVDDYGSTTSYNIELTNASGETNSIVIGSANQYEAGLMSVADKTKLDSALTEHQKLYIFTVKVNGVELEVYKPNAMAGEINLTPEILGALSNDDGKAIAKAIAEAVARAQEAYSYTDTLRNQFDAHEHPYLPISGGIVRGDINIDGTLYVDNIKGYSENSSYLTLGTGDNTGYVYITDTMVGKNENGEQSWSIGANSGNATFSSVSQTSDQRLKENIHDVDKSFTEKYWATENGLIHEFDWIKSEKHANGMIAQELLNYIPEAVNHNEEADSYSVDYTSATCKMMGAIFKKIKELENEITTLKQEIKNLKTTDYE